MKRVFVSLVALCATACLSATAFGQEKIKVEVKRAERFDTSRPLREVTPLKAKTNRKDFEPKRPAEPSAQFDDPAIQASTSPSVAITNFLNFEGVGEGLAGYNVNVAPPDTTGAVGATQYVQWVNLSFAVFDKVSGGIVYGPAAGNTLFAGFGGPCETSNDGDPLVLYDKVAGRWVLSQFAVPGGAQGYWQCVAVSQTSDATGAYNRYAFQYTQFNDYPKMGIWPDAYYVTFNMFQNGISFAGSRACAYDRAAMIAGLPATQQCFQTSTAYGSLLPADWDGATAPPPGSPNYMLNFGTNLLRLWKFSVNWANPTLTTFTGPTNINVAAFTRGCNGGACVPQPGTNQKLDSLGDRLMYRLAYRNFGTHQSLVVNHTVKAGARKNDAKTGIRWYEIRNPSGTPVVHQQGTYSPDTNYRWMGSAAMDKVGNLAVGFSVSSGTLRPTIRFAARAASDPLNTLGSETNVLTGTGSQLTNLARWGDYATLSIDPVDDCTFWFTTEYLATNGTFNWHTRINNFKLQGCQ